MNFYAKTDTGRARTSNQDYVFASDTTIGALPNLFLIADGMGGHNAGEYASEHAIKIVLNKIRTSQEKEPVSVLKQAITAANEEIYVTSLEEMDKNGMGTTIVAANIDEGQLNVANVGDSRLYLISEQSIRQITRDHSVVEELVRRGALSEEDASHHKDKHKITRAVGAEKEIRVDFFDVTLTGDEIILMCTDGLTNMVENQKILEILSSKESLKQRVETLVAVANENGGRDNISVLVIEPFSDEVKVC